MRVSAMAGAISDRLATVTAARVRISGMDRSAPLLQARPECGGALSGHGRDHRMRPDPRPAQLSRG
ncbi:hypothetical protein XFLAVUS301_30590 [Xanthobacter flavus]|uniref:Uncharacterized protein n=1 Tax=Xanthobacter flavus TaxID=281 RepID=A0A9W6FKK2_XANFL|nr:hypothetical protein XFLAVUS301_30590 [Xanthobacter flavus]